MPLTITQYNKFEYTVNINKKDPYISNSFFLIDPQFFIHWQKNYLQKTDHSFCVKSKNEHNYDPELGRFLQEDPAGQSINPYLYCGNSPLSYVDPDGEFWWLVAAVIDCAIKGAIAGAAVNGAVAAATGGNIGNAMLQGAVGGAISGGIFGAVGSVAGSMGWASGGLEKIAMHSVAGGISSSVQGGDFGSGAIGGGMAQAFAPMIDGLGGSAERIAAGASVGGFSAWALGGDALSGALAGGFGRAFNDEMHMTEKILDAVDNVSTAVMIGGMATPWPGDELAGAVGKLGAKGMKLLSKGEIKMLEKGGVYAEKLKSDIMGTKSVSKFNLFKNLKGDISIHLSKRAVGPGEATGLNIKNF